MKTEHRTKNPLYYPYKSWIELRRKQHERLDALLDELARAKSPILVSHLSVSIMCMEVIATEMADTKFPRKKGGRR